MSATATPQHRHGTGTQQRVTRTDAGDVNRVVRQLIIEHAFTLDQPDDIPDEVSSRREDEWRYRSSVPVGAAESQQT